MSYIEWIRGRVGHRQLILTFASVVLRDAGGHILLQHRTDFDIWGLPGGILEPGESILECAQRELGEETGLRAGDLHLVGVYADPRYDTVYPNGDHTQAVISVFRAHSGAREPFPDNLERPARWPMTSTGPTTVNTYPRLARLNRAAGSRPLGGGVRNLMIPLETPFVTISRAVLPRCMSNVAHAAPSTPHFIIMTHRQLASLARANASFDFEALFQEHWDRLRVCCRLVDLAEVEDLALRAYPHPQPPAI
jgi:8-oxo-dGTP pyrophosphatase MutT (NUDIX family)